MFKVWFLIDVNDGSTIETQNVEANNFGQAVKLFLEESGYQETNIIKIIRLF
jgi:hypothetical protein